MHPLGLVSHLASFSFEYRERRLRSAGGAGEESSGIIIGLAREVQFLLTQINHKGGFGRSFSDDLKTL